MITEALEELRAAGWTDRRIGEAIGLHEATIYRMRVGEIRSMKWENGRKLLEIVVKQREGKS